MASLTDLTFKVGHLTGLSNSDLQGDDDDASPSTGPRARPGTIAWIVDAYGPRIVKYVRAVSSNGATSTSTVRMGSPLAYDSDTQNIITTSFTVTSGTTTSFVTTGGGADVSGGNHQGALCFVTDDAGAAGAAPEGEAAVVASNSATAFTLEGTYPLSAALAVNDTVDIVSTYQMEDSFDGDEAWTISGIVIATDGFSQGNYGWVHQEGYCMCRHIASAITEGDPVVADYRAIGPFGSDGQELWLGIAAATGASTDETNPFVPVKVKLWSHSGTGASP